MTQSRISAWCDALLELCWLSALVLTPLFFNVHSDRVFEPDKLTLLRSLALLTTTLLIVKFIDAKGWTQWRQLTWKDANSIWRVPFVAPIVAVVLIYLVSNYFSVTRSVSWAGSYQRLQGTYTTISYILIFFGVMFAIRNTAQIQRIATLAIVVSIPVALYGMLQRFGLDPLPWGGNVVTRVAGHMGNAIFIGAYIIMVIPLTLGRIISAFTNILSDEDLNIADIIRSSIYIFTLAIQLIALYMSGSRGPLLGLLVGLFAFVVIFLISLKNSVSDEDVSYKPKDFLASTFGVVISVATLFIVTALPESIGDFAKFGLFIASIGVSTLVIFVLVALRIGWKWLWLSWMLLSLWGAIWLGMFNLTDDLIDAGYGDNAIVSINANWRELPTIGRFGKLLENQQTTSRVRIFIWRGVVDMLSNNEPIPFPDGTEDPYFALRPFVGYGPEAMYVAYNNFYPPELGTVEARNASPDRSHNETWDAFVITGGLGFLIWQWLYLSVFYYVFSWLGVVRQRRDTILLVALWFIGGGVLSYLFAVNQEPAFIGVAFPFGSIIGLIIYLVYYAITARADKDSKKIDPFQPEQMLMIALVAAILGFYVEIHFGIAIASTRTHFFVYVGMLLALGHLIPSWRDVASPADAQAGAANESEGEETKAKSTGRGSRRRKRSGDSATVRRGSGSLPGWFTPTVIWTYLMSLILMTLGFNYTIFTPPPNLQIQTLDDIPTAGEIFQQAFFINPAQDFSESPFIYLLMMMAWGLGVLIILSEMSKNGQWKFKTDSSRGENHQRVGILFSVVGVVLVGLFIVGYFELLSQPITPTQRVGFLTLAPLGAIAAFFAGTSLLSGRQNNYEIAVGVAVGGISVSLPIMVVGGSGIWVGLILFALSGSALYMLWHKSLQDLVRPSLIISVGSLATGLTFCYLHASRIRNNFITPASVTATTTDAMRRVAEAAQFADLLTLFYVFLFFAIFVASFFAPLALWRQQKQVGTNYAFISLVVLLPITFWLISTTNLNIIRADMVYKRGKPWDQQATQVSGNPENIEIGQQLWDNAIAVYQHALDLTPREDFYYLWLGRAYLEESALLDGQERTEVLETAKESLIRAQNINPLNTDHTANLARLHTRWAGLENGPKRDELIDAADTYYQAASQLSPQNAVIRNEHARMIYSFTQDCDDALDLYNASLDSDPTFEQTYLERAEIASVCMTNADDPAEQEMYYDLIFDSLVDGVAIGTENGRSSLRDVPQRWARAAQAYQQVGAYDYAIRAYEAAEPYADDRLPLWQIQYLNATARAESGDISGASELAAIALESAPAEGGVVEQIEQFISGLPAVEN